MEQCTSLSTDNFGILKEAFRAFSKLDPKSLYITWPKNCTWTQQSRFLRNTTERQTQNDTEYSQQNDAWEQVQINFSWKSTVLFILKHWQFKAAHVSYTGFSPKAPDCLLILCELCLIWVHINIRNSALSGLLTTSKSQRTWTSITLHKLTKNLHFNTEKPKLQKTHQKDKPRTALNLESKTMHHKKSNPNSLHFNCALHSTGLAVNKQSG